MGEDINENELEEMIREADKDGDGKVSYQEFVRIVTNSSSNGEYKQTKSTIENQKILRILGSEAASFFSEIDPSRKTSLYKPDKTYCIYQSNLCLHERQKRSYVRRRLSCLTRSKRRDSVHLVLQDDQIRHKKKCSSLPSHSLLSDGKTNAKLLSRKKLSDAFRLLKSSFRRIK